MKVCCLNESTFFHLGLISLWRSYPWWMSRFDENFQKLYCGEFYNSWSMSGLTKISRSCIVERSIIYNPWCMSRFDEKFQKLYCGEVYILDQCLGLTKISRSFIVERSIIYNPWWMSRFDEKFQKLYCGEVYILDQCLGLMKSSRNCTERARSTILDQCLGLMKSSRNCTEEYNSWSMSRFDENFQKLYCVEAYNIQSLINV